MSARELLRSLAPAVLVDSYRGVRRFFARRRDRRLSRKDLFTRIYEQHEWGGKGEGVFCSGSGSTASHGDEYGGVVREFIAEHGIKSVVDLGCGDFTVAGGILMPGVRYVGVDIVEALVERNRKRFADAHVSFEHLDVVTDPLPDGELCLIRQVLQHLSNDEIQAVLAKTRKYRYTLITEHLPSPSRSPKPNKDKPHGPDTRVYDDSGVYVDQPPFSLPVSRTLLDASPGQPLVASGEVIRTVVVEQGL